MHVVQWLANRAGYGVPNQSKAKVIATQGNLSSRDLPSLAKSAIESALPAKVPGQIFTILGSVIAARKEFAAQHKQISRQPEPNDGHSTFVDVLQKVRQILLGPPGR